MQIFAALSSSRSLDETDVAALQQAATVARDAIPDLSDSMTDRWWSPSRRTAVVTLGRPPERASGPARAWGDGRRRQVLDGFPILRHRALPTEGPMDLDGADGRFALLDVADDTVALTCDRIGSYAVYARRLPGDLLAVSNSPALLARVPPHPGFDEAGIEDFLVASWTFGERTMWDGITRLPPGTSTVTNGVLRPSTTRLIDLALDAASRPVHRDVEVSADLLRDTLAAVARDARGPVELGLSGGRDSRVVLAAAMAAGLRPHCFTVALKENPSAIESGDVAVARRVTQELGLEHEVRVITADFDRSEHWLRALTGSASPMDTTPSSMGATGRPPVLLTGAAVELGWLTHGLELTQAPPQQAIRGSVSAWIHTFPPPLGRTGAYERTLERGCRGPRAWHEAGLPSNLLAEAFFAFERAAGWAAPVHFAYTPFFDTVSPGWSADLLPPLWALDPQDRELDRWRRGMVHALCPEIENIPFSGGAPVWPDQARQSSYMLRGEKLDKIRRFTRSRLLGNQLGRVPGQVAGFKRMQRDIRDALHHDGRLRQVVHPGRVQRLSRTPVTRLDPRSLHRLTRVAHIARVLQDGA